MIELTLEQRHAIAQRGAPAGSVRAVDPDTQTTYVIIREELFERVKALLVDDDDDQFVRELNLQVMETFGREGWNDPTMDIYNELDPRRSP